MCLVVGVGGLEGVGGFVGECAFVGVVGKQDMGVGAFVGAFVDGKKDLDVTVGLVVIQDKGV